MPKQSQNQKQGRNHQILAPFAEILVIVLERIRNPTEKWVLL